MCIICYKPKNKKFNKDALAECVTRNRDGCGYVYFDTKQHRAVLSKGYFGEGCNAMIKTLLELPNEFPVIFHARIATHGKHPVGQCHPFPICADKSLIEAEDLTLKKGYALAHNGIFYGISMGAEYSDTQAFIYKILAPLAEATESGGGLLAPSLKTTMDTLADNSKLAIMSAENGEVALFGKGWVWDGGLAYSNATYKPAPAYAPAAYGYRTEIYNIRLFELKKQYAAQRKKSYFYDEYEPTEFPKSWSAKQRYYIDELGGVYGRYADAPAYELETYKIEKKYYNAKDATLIPTRLSIRGAYD